jgi:hypothetical protein
MANQGIQLNIGEVCNKGTLLRKYGRQSTEGYDGSRLGGGVEATN